MKKPEGSISPNKSTSTLVSPTVQEGKPITKRFGGLSLKGRPESLKKCNSDSTAQEDFVTVGCVDDEVFEVHTHTPL